MMIVYIGILVFSFILDAYKWLSSANIVIWVLLIFLLIILAIGGGFYGYYYYYPTNQSESMDTSDQPNETVPLEGTGTNTSPSSISPNDLTLLDNHQFKLRVLDGEEEEDPLNTSSNSTITYENFKEIINEPSFITQFTSAIKECLEMKRKKYIKLKSDAQKELETFNKDDENDLLGSALQKLRNEQYSNIKEYITRIDKILDKIKQKQSKTNDTDTRIRLQSMLYKKDVGLDYIVGRNDIKDFLSVRLYAFAQNPKIFFKSFQNIILMAGPGSGKTRIATTMGHVFAQSGLLVDDNVIITTKAGVISPYVNETAHKTHSFMLSTLESLVFFDEAYDFVPPKNALGGSLYRDHGFEAITQIVNDMDKMMGLHIIVAGGYENEMKDRFLGSNEGMNRRFPHQIVLQNYTSKELSAILIDNLKSTNPDLVWTEEMNDYLYTMIYSSYTKDAKIFQNQAGDMINLSSEISHAIYGTKNIWPENWQQTFLRGFNNYLENKGLKMIKLFNL